MRPPVCQPQNPLFTNGENFQLNACVGDNGGPYDLFDYGKGFFEGAHAIVKAAADRVAPVDLLIYPTAFAYRHGIELLLKQLVVSLNTALGASESFDKHHRMSELWEDVKELNAKLEHAIIEGTAVDRAGQLIGHFDEFDPTGQVFRYPEDLKGNRHLADHKLINVEVLHAQMRELQAILEQWYYNACDRCGWQSEADRDIRSAV